ncbi:(2Fe-2S)-binding protein [Shinella sp.]|uniref:(2Fe-2S)-binding protein n=1 Tax=Shinella sp. TaxID=1870904 RepID=UPI00301CE9AF
MDRKDKERAGRGGIDKAACHPFLAAMAVQSANWPDIPTGTGRLEAGWITAAALFASDDAIEEYLRYEGSFHADMDRKTCAAAMMADYGYIFSTAVVPLFAGFGLIPDLSPRQFALRFYVTPLEHDGQVHEARRAHVRFLSPAFSTDRGNDTNTPCETAILDSGALCDLFRRSIEDHFRPLVGQLHARTGLARSALWRLVADAVAGTFLDAGRRFGRIEAAKATAMTVLKQPGSPLDNRQLHYFDLTLADEGHGAISHTFRARGGCCRHYTVDDGAVCPTCVLNTPERRDAELRQAMRHHVRKTMGMSS